jgi:predicted nucleic acid-binding protein
VSVFLDTNILIYHLTGIDKAKSERCRELLHLAERNEVDLVASELVIAEAVWLLQYRLALTRERIRDILGPIVRLPGLHLPNKQLWPVIFDVFCEKRVDFVDAYHAVAMKRAGVTQIYSYDKDFDRIEGVQRLTP